MNKYQMIKDDQLDFHFGFILLHNFQGLPLTHWKGSLTFREASYINCKKYTIIGSISPPDHCIE